MIMGSQLTPLDSGVIVLAGVKASNLPDEIRTHPRVVTWDSQNEHWTSKDLPTNCRAVFVTRFIGHAAFRNIHAQTIKRRITLFQPQGTGIITRQVKELLNMNPASVTQGEVPQVQQPKNSKYNKLSVLHQYIDWSKTNIDNAKVLMAKAKEHGVSSTMASLANMVGALRRKQGKAQVYRPETNQHTKPTKQQDVTITMLDNLIGELKDIRTFLAATVDENSALRARIDKFKKMLDGEK